jgi:hypothetical protein
MNGGGWLAAIITPKQPNKIPPNALWCADNGCFGRGYPGDIGWFTWLHQFTTEERSRCLFAVAPDVVGDARATVERSVPWLPEIRAAGYRPAYVLQDGQDEFCPPWGLFDVAFVGGTTSWKFAAGLADLVHEAKLRGKWVHMGRVNSRARLIYAAMIGCDSVDGTYLKFGPDLNLRRMGGWVEETNLLLTQMRWSDTVSGGH